MFQLRHVRGQTITLQAGDIDMRFCDIHDMHDTELLILDCSAAVKISLAKVRALNVEVFRHQ